MIDKVARSQPIWLTAIYTIVFGTVYGSAIFFPVAFDDPSQFIAIVVSFAAFFLALGLFSHFIAFSAFVLAIAAMVSGAVAGFAWWFFWPSAPESLILPISSGTLGGLVWAGIEGHFFVR